jgi:type IV pilus assembly protein PilB
MAPPRLRLGQLLVDARMLTLEALEDVLVVQKQDGRRLGVLLVERGLINETQLTQILSHQLSVPWVSLLHIEFSRQLLNLVPHNVAEKYCLVPIYVRHVRGQGETLYVAMDDPTNDDGLRECQSFSGLPVRAMIAPPTDIRNAIRVYYGGAPIKSPAAVPAPATPPPQTLNPMLAATQLSARSPEPVAPVRASRTLPEAGAEQAKRQPSRPDDGPVIETREIPLNRKGAERLQRLFGGDKTDQPPSSERLVKSIPTPRGRAPRMVALTLLDGTTINLPAQNAPTSERRGEPATRPDPPVEEGEGQLTARDLVAALRAVAHGADASEILGPTPSWEAMFAALLSLLLKKHLIADWEFVEEFTAAGGMRRPRSNSDGG